jgi:hypothetical protein
MSNCKYLGDCERCSKQIVSPRGRKDHTIGEPSRLQLHRYKAGDCL